MVFVHELGHFVVARRNGIAAHEFGFGFPPRIFGVYKNEQGKWSLVKGGKNVETKNTIYSLNWFPIGGFVRIKGEDGSRKNDKDSFANKSPWSRSKVLIAGVAMNFILAWLLFSISFMLGTFQEVSDNDSQNGKILINMVSKDSPSQKMGIMLGDEIIAGGVDDLIDFRKIEDVQSYINENKGQEIILKIKRKKEILYLSGIPRAESVENQGALGIGLSRVEIIRYGFFQSFYQGFLELLNVFLMMFITFKQLFLGNTSGVDVTGIIGIAVYTGQVIPLGIVQILRFAAILSVNLGIINIFPFPALDGGRVLFIIIEKIKGSPVSEKMENIFHTAGFMILILLMVFVTFKDLVRFEIFEKIISIF